MESRTQKAVDLYVKEHKNCAQAVALTYKDLVYLKEEDANATMFGFGHGMGGRMATCGAISGAVYLAGLQAYQDGKSQQELHEVSKEITKRFYDQHGTITCKELKDPKSGHFASCLDCIRDASKLCEDVLFPKAFDQETKKSQ